MFLVYTNMKSWNLIEAWGSDFKFFSQSFSLYIGQNLSSPYEICYIEDPLLFKVKGTKKH